MLGANTGHLNSCIRETGPIINLGTFHALTVHSADERIKVVDNQDRQPIQYINTITNSIKASKCTSVSDTSCGAITVGTTTANNFGLRGYTHVFPWYVERNGSIFIDSAPFPPTPTTGTLIHTLSKKHNPEPSYVVGTKTSKCITATPSTGTVTGRPLCPRHHRVLVLDDSSPGEKSRVLARIPDCTCTSGAT